MTSSPTERRLSDREEAFRIPADVITGEARLRPKNQLTLPEPIVEAFAARPDDLLVFEADPQRPRTATVRLIPHEFAGVLTGVYGTTEDVKAFLREEHAAWDE